MPIRPSLVEFLGDRYFEQWYAYETRKSKTKSKRDRARREDAFRAGFAACTIIQQSVLSGAGFVTPMDEAAGQIEKLKKMAEQLVALRKARKGKPATILKLIRKKDGV
jgi:hypothetical protein